MTKSRLYILLISLSMVGYAWLGWNIAEDSATPTTCMFKAVTHLPCPSCGTTRSLVLLVNGDVQGSLLVNPLGIILALVLVIVPVWLLIDMLRRSDSLYRWYGLAEQMLTQKKWISIPAIAVILLNWFWNIAKGL